MPSPSSAESRRSTARDRTPSGGSSSRRSLTSSPQATTRATTKPNAASGYWLFKSEPETYSFEQLTKDRRTNWNDVRNYQARNFLREARVGDLALIYHSGDAKAVVGVARVVREAYPDPDPETPGVEWVQIDIAHETPFTRAVPLAEIKATKALEGLLLIKQSRLSCMPISKEHFDLFLKLGGAKVSDSGERS
jgi:predicted RNA-binding protein with PUA-like domain